MEYADLHRHLDGSLRRSTVRELAQEKSLSLPSDLAFSPGMGLDEALARFAFTLSLLDSPGAVRRVASEICQDAASEGVTCLEIRFAPQLHARASNPSTAPSRGAVASVLDAALDGIAGRAGLLLCGLYGEPPAVLETLVDLASRRTGVVGIDLAGGPAPEHRWKMLDYAPAFRRAAELGLGRTVHAGEGRPPAEIRVAVVELLAQRIGHGTTLLEDPDLPSLLMERGVTVEACVTSNWHVGAIARIDEHPLPQWLRMGVKACICTDNTLLSGVDAPEEHRRVAGIPGMTPDLLLLAVTNGHAAAFNR